MRGSAILTAPTHPPSFRSGFSAELCRSAACSSARAARRWAIPRGGNRCPVDPHLPSRDRSQRRRLAIPGRKPGCRCAAGSGASRLSRRQGCISPPDRPRALGRVLINARIGGPLWGQTGNIRSVGALPVLTPSRLPHASAKLTKSGWHKGVYRSKAKMRFQSFFMLTTIQPSFLASS